MHRSSVLSPLATAAFAIRRHLPPPLGTAHAKSTSSPPQSPPLKEAPRHHSSLLFSLGEELQSPFVVRFLSLPASAHPAVSCPPPSFHAGPRKCPGAPRPHQLPRAALSRPESSFSPPPVPCSTAAPFHGEHLVPAIFLQSSRASSCPLLVLSRRNIGSRRTPEPLLADHLHRRNIGSRRPSEPVPVDHLLH
jgi:hypothetical protein